MVSSSSNETTSHETALPFEDETLSSWFSRFSHQFSGRREDLMEKIDQYQCGLADAFIEDPDYPTAPGWRAAVAAVTGVDMSVFTNMAAPSPWVLVPGRRRSACLKCLGEDGDITKQYMRQVWTDSWRTTCSRHQMPLVYMHAIGAGWGLKSWSFRQTYDAFIREAYRKGIELEEHWREVPHCLREAINRAELLLMNAFAEHFGRRQASWTSSSGELRVWEDLLILVSANWMEWDEAPYMSAAVSTLKTGRQFFRFRSLAGLPRNEEPQFSVFHSIEDPAIRRLALLCVVDALTNLSMHPKRRDMNGKAHKMWRAVAAELPDRAWAWVAHRSEAWPASWKAWLADWSRAF